MLVPAADDLIDELVMVYSTYVKLKLVVLLDSTLKTGASHLA